MFAKYSNGWGHLVVTIAVMVMMTVLLVTKALDATAAMSAISIVVSFWFMSGTVNRFSTPPQQQGTLTPAQQASPLPPITQPTQQGPQPIVLGNPVYDVSGKPVNLMVNPTNPVHGG